MARFFRVADGRAEARPYRMPTPLTVFEPFMKVDSEQLSGLNAALAVFTRACREIAKPTHKRRKMSAEAGAKIAAAQRARWAGGRIYRIVDRGGAASRAGCSHSVSRWSVGHFISQFVPQEAGNTQLNAPTRSVFYSLSERLKPAAAAAS
jgi:hypothetical protein